MVVSCLGFQYSDCSLIRCSRACVFLVQVEYRETDEQLAHLTDQETDPVIPDVEHTAEESEAEIEGNH